jgi:NtrC-family two-component system response regulator AlgB
MPSGVARLSYTALVVDDDADVRQSIRLCLEADGGKVTGVGSLPAALQALERAEFDVVLLDLWLKQESGLTGIPAMLRTRPGLGIVVITAFATFETAVEAMRLGASDYLPKPFTPEQVRLATRRVLAAARIQQHDDPSRSDEGATDALSFQSRSPAFRALLDKASRVAQTDSVVLLRGESGTGKNVLARWIHEQSRRAQKKFVTVHAPTLAGDLMASALFGHRRGAFTGAVADMDGKVEEANGGTLFLDEVADLGQDAQARLLRFANDRTYERLGETKERTADVRLVAATHRPLEDDVRAGRFREDLLFRLNVITLVLPALRERREDTVPLALAHLRFFERAHGRSGLAFSEACERALGTYTWPGNLRELRNAVERAVVLCPSTEIEPADLGIATEGAAASGETARTEVGAPVSLDELEREHLARVVAASPTLEAAARTLGIDPSTLQRKRKRYGLL